MGLRLNWMRGPYVQFLAVLPPFQCQGLGTALLAWVEAQARAEGERNLWIAASEINASNSALAKPRYQSSLGQLADSLGEAFSNAAGSAGAGDLVACSEQPTHRHPIRTQRMKVPTKNMPPSVLCSASGLRADRVDSGHQR